MCYKAGWVGKRFRSSGGEETGVVHGILLGMAAIKRRYPLAKFVMVWDGLDRKNNWRLKIFPQYKSNRSESISQEHRDLRESVTRQIGLVKELLLSVGVPQIEIPLLEADDVIGILTEKIAARGWKPMVFSSDQDYLQLMDYGVEIITSASGPPIDERAVKSKWRCTSENVLRLRSLLGDSSDGVPRPVSGVGPVAAARYIEAGVTPEVSRFEDMPRSTREQAERLREQWPLIHMNYRLMRILRGCHDPDFPKELVAQVSVETRRVLKALAEPTKLKPSDYQAMLDTLARLDLQEAIANRRDIWNLQSSK
jgi:5'-3' exonuclease